MPLIILTGYPCSGLSYRASQLAALLQSVQDRLLAEDNNDTGTQNISLLKGRYKLVIVPSHDSSHPRTVYDNARTEKEARGVAFARIKRALTRDTIVVADGMNYIKGWRYQLWCEAKSVGTTCCVVQVGAPAEKCASINEARLRRREQQKALNNNRVENNDGRLDSNPPIHNSDTLDEKLEPLREQTVPSQNIETGNNEDPYPPALLQNLIFRYEEPSMHSRWDKPLFAVPWSDEKPPVEDIFTALTGIPLCQSPTTDSVSEESLATLLAGNQGLSPTNTTNTISSITPSLTTTFTRRTTTNTIKTINPASTGGNSITGRPHIKPHQATIQPTQTDSSALYSIEKTTNSIINSIRSFTTNNPSAEAAMAKQNQQRHQQQRESLNEESLSSYGNGIIIPVDSAESSTPIFIPEHIAVSTTTDELAGAGGILALSRLQRLRRQWISLNRAFVGHNPAGKRLSLRPDQVGDTFVRFLNREIAGDGGDYEVI